MGLTSTTNSSRVQRSYRGGGGVYFLAIDWSISDSHFITRLFSKSLGPKYERYTVMLKHVLLIFFLWENYFSGFDGLWLSSTTKI